MGTAEPSAKKMLEKLQGNKYILDKTISFFNSSVFCAIVDEFGVVFNEATQTFLFELEKENSDKNCFVALDEIVIVFPFFSYLAMIDFTFKRQKKSSPFSPNFYLKNVFKGFIGNEFLGGVLRVSKGHLGIFKLHHTPIKDSDDSEIIFHRFSITREAKSICKMQSFSVLM